jgi:hypothetical protein
MLSDWILHRRHIHWGNTCLFLPPTTCFTVTVNEIKDTQFVLLIYDAGYKNSIPKQIIPGLEPTTFRESLCCSTNVPHMPCTSLLKLDIFGAQYLSSFYPPHVVSKKWW